MTTKVLFICLGNICRSPIGEAVFLDEIKKRNLTNKFECDSAALGDWHIGNLPDKRALNVLKSHNIDYDRRARVITNEDFYKFDYIFGMDMDNIKALNNMKPMNAKCQIKLLGVYHPNGENIIKDPYYDNGIDGFEKCFDQCKKSIDVFLTNIN